VPFAIVSPWARPDHVSHHVYDHTSICALVEAKWNLPAMTYRDANAGTCWTWSTWTGGRRS
jgi:phospholipase C